MNTKRISRSTTRYYLCATTCGDHDFNGDCDYALLAITPEVACRLLVRMDIMARLQERFENLYALQEFDRTPVIFSAAMLNAADLQCDTEWEEITEQQARRLLPPANDWKELPRIECLSANSSGDEVYWTMYARNTAIEISTAALTRDVLYTIAGLPATPTENESVAPEEADPGHHHP